MQDTAFPHLVYSITSKLVYMYVVHLYRRKRGGALHPRFTVFSINATLYVECYRDSRIFIFLSSPHFGKDKRFTMF